MVLYRVASKKLLALPNNFAKATTQWRTLVLALQYGLAWDKNINFKLCSVSASVIRPFSTSSYKLSGRQETPFELHNDSYGFFDFKELECNASVESRKNHFLCLMCETFYLSEEEAHDIMEAHPFLWKEFFHKTFTFLRGVGLEKTTFMRYPWLVAIPPEDIEVKLEIIEQRFKDLANLNVGAPILKLSSKKLTHLTKSWEEEAAGIEFPSKFHYLGHVLEVALPQLMYLVEPKPFLYTLPLSRLKESLTICLDAGMSKEDIMKDMWVLRNRPAKIKNRVEILQQVKVPIKPWIIRATVPAFETYIREYWETRIDMQDFPDAKSYLAARLKCDQNQVEKMMKTFPGVRKATVTKMKRILDYLLIEKNLDPSLIITTPRVLCQKYETIKTRLEHLEALNIRIGSLWIVCATEINFQKSAERWRNSE